MDPAQIASTLTLNHRHQPVPVGVEQDENGDWPFTVYATADYKPDEDGEVTGVLVTNGVEVRLYPLPHGEPHAMFDGQTWLPLPEVPDHLTEELWPDLLGDRGYVVVDRATSEDLWWRAAKLHDLPVALVHHAGSAVMLTADAAGTALGWYLAVAFLRIGMTAPLGLAWTLLNTSPTEEVDAPEQVAQIRHGLRRVVESRRQETEADLAHLAELLG